MVTQYTHPDDLKYMAQKVAKNIIGRDLSDDDLKQFIKGYHGMEAAQTAQQYGAATPGGPGGSYTGAPNVDAEAAQFAEQTHPTEAYATKYVDAFKTFDQMINATATGARPTASGGTTGV
jgi:hypothetical protein